jgi:hypothetical protein
VLACSLAGVENMKKERTHVEMSIHESFIPNKHIHMSAINTIILYTFSWEIKKCCPVRLEITLMLAKAPPRCVWTTCHQCQWQRKTIFKCKTKKQIAVNNRG